MNIWYTKPGLYNRILLKSENAQRVPDQTRVRDLYSDGVWDGTFAILDGNGAKAEATAEMLALVRNFNGSIEDVDDYDRLEDLLAHSYDGAWKAVTDEWDEWATVHDPEKAAELSSDRKGKGRIMTLRRLDSGSVADDLAFILGARDQAKALLEEAFPRLHRSLGGSIIVDERDADLAAGVVWHFNGTAVVNEFGTRLADLIAPLHSINDEHQFRQGPLNLKRRNVSHRPVGLRLNVILPADLIREMYAEAKWRGLSADEVVYQRCRA